MRSRGQSGITLVEILLSMAIASLLMVPLGAWAYGTMKAGIVSRDELGRASATGLLNVYFLRDVASARGFATRAEGAVDCTGVPSGSSGVPVVRIQLSGESPASIVYVMVGGTATTPAKLVRHRCGPDGTYESGNRIMGRVQLNPDPAACFNPASQSVPCSSPEARRVSFTVKPWTNSGPRAPLTVSGTRRTTGAGTGFSLSNPPDVRFTVSPGPRGYTDTEFTVTSQSTDPDGDALQLTWSLPPNATPTGNMDGETLKFHLPSSGEVVLTASDGNGNTAAGSVFIEIVNRSPSITADPTCSLVSGRTFSLSGTAVDPDGDALAATWTDPVGATVTGLPATWTAPAGMFGEQVLQLSVSDGRGEAPSRYARCIVGALPATGVQFSPAVGLGGAINAIPPGGVLPVTFIADTPGVTSTSWQLFRKGETNAVNSEANAAAWTLDFTSAEAGEYELIVTTDGNAGPRIPFMVNAQPEVSLAVTAQAGTVPKLVSFRSTAADPDGSISSTVWDFGDGSPVSYNPAGDVDHTFTASGTYTVTFTVTDDRGASASVSQNITVEEAG